MGLFDFYLTYAIVTRVKSNFSSVFSSVKKTTVNLILFLDGNICDMKFHIDTSPADLIPTLEAIDKQMLEAEEQNQFEIIKLKADSPNCTFST